MMNPSPLAHLAYRPLALLPSALDSFAMRFAEPAALALQPEANRFVGQRTQGTPYRVQGDTAIVGILNPLVTREGSAWGVTSYEFLNYSLEAAARDPKIKSVVLDGDSAGGNAAGMVELAAQIRRINSSKPVIASANGLMCSAAYCLASAAKTIISTPSSTLGSIGVLLVHGDFSRALDKAGVGVSLIHAGKKKVLGNMYQPLSKDDRSDLQKEVDSYFGLFVNAVAAGRGARLTEQKARATEGATFLGEAAKKIGLVDDVGDFDAALSVARRAGVGATSYSVTLPKAAAALPAPAAQTKPDVAAGNHGWDDIVAKVNARQALPAPASASSVSKKEVVTAFARSIARIKGEPSDKRIGHGWDEVIGKINARLARERGIRK